MPLMFFGGVLRRVLSPPQNGKGDCHGRRRHGLAMTTLFCRCEEACLLPTKQSRFSKE